MSRLEMFILWPMCVALALCVDAMGIARYGGEVNPRMEWLIILSGGTLIWILVRKLLSLLQVSPKLQVSPNRYLLSTRVRLWFERQLPSWPPL